MGLNADKIVKVKLPTKYGIFDLYAYDMDNAVHLALVKGDLSQCEAPFVRVHSECMTGDVFHSQKCDCGGQLISAMKKIEQENCGMIIYLRQEGRGIGLYEKLKAYQLQEQGLDTVETNHSLGFESDCRKYDVAFAFLNYFNVKKMRLITNNPDKIEALENAGFNIIERVKSIMDYNEFNTRYMKTKKIKMGHLLEV